MVAQWINCQYYFSTVAPEVFGAGTKTIHNVVGNVGVISGHNGDLRLGLPWQSVADGDRLPHEPLRLLAVIQAPLARIDTVVERNPILQHLFGNDWVGVAARENPGQSWRRWTSPAGAPGRIVLHTRSSRRGDDPMTAPMLTKMVKIEVVVPGSDAPAVRDLIQSVGATGYTSVSGVSGLGHHGYRQGRLLFNQQAALELLITVVPESKVDALLAGLRPLLDASPGVLFVTDTYVSRPEYFT